MSNTATSILDSLVKRSDLILNNIRQKHYPPNGAKTLQRRFSMTETAELVKRNRETIRAAEKAGKVPLPESITQSGRRLGYTLSEINRLRRYFGTQPWRAEDDEPCILAIQNFKGGVGKSICSVHLAQYLSMQGYRVLLIDGDSQASSTAAFGYIPDDEIEQQDTLYKFLVGDAPDLSYAVRKTHWDGLDLIPSCLMLYGAEYVLAGLQARRESSTYKFYEQLSLGIDSLKRDYDVIIIDSPPALGMMALSILYAANSLIIPVPPAMYDFTSTKQYFTALLETLSEIGDKELSFFRVLISRYDVTADAQGLFVGAMREAYSRLCLDAGMLKTDEILNASAFFCSVYDLEGPIGSRKTYKRAMTILNGVCSEIEKLIVQTWQSRAKALREVGAI